MNTVSEHHPDYTIVRSGEARTVWINGLVNCLGRFSPLGYEIYRKLDKELSGEEASTATLSVKIANLVNKDWENFKTLMREHHGIDLSEVENPLMVERK
jgi:hypothetical protein